MANRLIYESSPYLLQHAHNPVDWYSWGDEAFARAKELHKPVLISIGYSACHWCHVMERESFEHPEVAAYMNEHFVNIKVDREEHPDVDHFYMDALQSLNGSGGWPLNMFATPDRLPFYGGTYFPPQRVYGRASWMEVLEAIQALWQHKQDDIAMQAGQMQLHLQQTSSIGADTHSSLVQPHLHTIADQLLRQADRLHGGFGGAPKFPSSMAILFLLQYAKMNNNEAALQHALFSLDKMIDGGIYDQIGGGFARYATDNEWMVPHFEKMLYDNALLISTLSHAYRITHQIRYKHVVEQTIGFCMSELFDGQAFYCALDADSEGEEGRYYTWTWDEWTKAIPNASNAITEYWGVRQDGNWEDVNILHVAVSPTEIIERYSLNTAEFEEMVATAKRQLLQVRAGRARPGVDDKVLLSWNALMNIALVDASVALKRQDWLESAMNHMEWLLRVFESAASLMHVSDGDRARIPGKLDDYAYLIKALLKLASASGKNSYIETAFRLTEYVHKAFSDEQERYFYYTNCNQQDIPVRKIEIYDGATPSANAIMVENLINIAMLYERQDLVHRAEIMIRDMLQDVVNYPRSFAQWAIAMQSFINGKQSLVIVGEGAQKAKEQWDSEYIPWVNTYIQADESSSIPMFKGKSNKGPLQLYFCEEFACRAPYDDINTMMREVFFL